MGKHYVPQRYLKGFECPENPGYIWMFDKKERAAKQLATKGVAQAADFYDDDVEVELNEQVEKPGNDVIDKIRRSEGIDDLDRRHLTFYIATMIRRVPAARTKAAAIAPAALKEVADEVRAWIEQGGREGRINEATKEKRLAEVAALEAKYRQQPPEQVVKQIRTPWPFESMLVAIYSMYWRVVRATGPSYFLTGDNPAYFFEGFGLGNPESEVILPLCTHLLLHCSWQQCQEMGVEEATEKLVREFNRRIASGAERFVFYHESAPWVLSVVQSTTEQCKRIRWVPKK